MRRGMLLLLTLGMALSCGLTLVYHAEPVRAQWSGWTPPQQPYNYASEVLTLNVDSLDFPAYCELFTGAGDTQKYQVTVLTYPDAYPVASGESTATDGHTWVVCSLAVTHPESLIRGRQYEFRWTRTSAARILYYYHDSTDGATGKTAYEYGFMKVGGESLGMCDLAMRCYGRMSPIDQDYWRVDATAFYWGEPDSYRVKWAGRAESANLGAVRLSIEWPLFEADSGSYDFTMLDNAMRCIMDTAQCEVLGCLVSCPTWASTRVVHDSFGDTSFTTTHAPPQNLFEPVASGSNYYARYLRALLPHCDSVHAWEVANEENDSGPYCSNPSRYVEGWFHRPDGYFYPGMDSSLRGLCSLYVRLAAITESVIRHDTSVPGHENDRILLGGVFGAADSGAHLTPGWKWIDLCYELAGNNVFWDGVAVHPYQSHDGLDPVAFEREAEMLRAVMRHHNDAGAMLWNTEVGWHKDWGENTNANALCEVFVTGKASEALPQSGYDQSTWWLLREGNVGWGHFPLYDTTMTQPYMSFYTFKQMTEALTGKRFNGRVMTGDAAKDDSVRMYEFEDTATLKRTWVCWRNGDTTGGSVNVKLPVRADTLAAESLAYADSIPEFAPASARDGWLSLSLNQRPVFVMEPAAATVSRPDLRVDSVRYSPSPGPMYVKAWVTNHGSRATPHNPSGMLPYPTWAVLSRNGDSLTQQVYTDSIAVGHQVEFTFNLTAPPSNSTLFSVLVNPLQAYVELGTDDNAGHALAIKP